MRYCTLVSYTKRENPLACARDQDWAYLMNGPTLSIGSSQISSSIAAPGSPLGCLMRAGLTPKSNILYAGAVCTGPMSFAPRSTS
jgi:hypothetical protein